MAYHNTFRLHVALVWLVLCCWTTTMAANTPSGGRAPSSKLCSSSNCQLPQCFCAGRRGPDNMQTHDIPQMVMLTFDDAVNKQNMDFYRTVLTRDRTNPNGCPITATFFVSHDWTDYKMVRELYMAGHEIADHSISHRLPRDWWSSATYRDWEEELDGQRKNIASKSGVPRFEVRGVRVPFLEVGGNTQFELMTDKAFIYDSSFLTGPYNERDWRLPAWPYTLEYAPELEYCDNSNCPTANFSSIWEVPLNRWLGLDGQACPMVDACTTQVLKDKSDALRYLWKNFNRHYGKNRAPLGINLHAVWLEEEFKLEALLEFIDGILELHDVYMVNIAKVVEWMKRPTTLGAITKFEPWLNCNNKRLLVQRRKPTKKPPTKSRKEQPSPTDSEEDLPRVKVSRRTKGIKDDSSGEDDSTNDSHPTPRRKIIHKKRIKGARKHKRTTTTMSPDHQDMGKGRGEKMLRDEEAVKVNDVEVPDAKDTTDTASVKVVKDKRQNTKGGPGGKPGRGGRAGTQTGDNTPTQSGGSTVIKSQLAAMFLTIGVVKYVLL